MRYTITVHYTDLDITPLIVRGIHKDDITMVISNLMLNEKVTIEREAEDD